MPTDQNQSDEDVEYGEKVKYEVINFESYPEWDDHTEVDEDTYIGEFRPEIPSFVSANIIRIIDADYDPEDVDIYSFPPEPLQDGNKMKVLTPRKSSRGVTTYAFDRWRCERCGNVATGPQLTVDGKIEDCIPEECPSCERNGPFVPAVMSPEESMDKYLDAVPDNPIWEPPTSAHDPGMDSLFDDVRDHIETYWDGDDWLYDGLAAYVIATWIREELDFVPHLLVRGTHESGKTRLLNTMREVSYRCVHTAAATPAAVFRAIDQYNVTMFVSEYHDLGEEVQQQIDAILKAGQKRGEVAMRAADGGERGYQPEVYDPFTHVAISTQFSVDDDMESRCFVVQTERTDAEMPRTIDDRDDLRCRLMGFRAEYLNSDAMAEARARVEQKMDDDGIFNRIGEKLSSILLVAELFDKDITRFIERVVVRDEESKSDTEEAQFVRALKDAANRTLERIDPDDDEVEVKEDWSNLELKQTVIRDSFNSIGDRDVSSRYITEIRDRMGFDSARYSDGVYLCHPNLKGRLKSLADEFNIPWKHRGSGPGAHDNISKENAGVADGDDSSDDGPGGGSSADGGGESDSDGEGEESDNSQSSRVQAAIEVVRDVDDGDGASKSTVVGRMVDRGFDPEKVEHT